MSTVWPAIDMEVIEAIIARAKPLLKVSMDSHAQPDALERISRLLGGAAVNCIFDATFADRFKGTLDDLVDKLEHDTRKVDNLTAHLQAMRRPKDHCKGSRRSVSPAGQLVGLHGNDLFRTLMTLQLPAAAPAEFYLEVALAAQSLIVHDQFDISMHVCERIVFGANSTVTKEYNFMAFKDHRNTLEKYVREHIDLADAAANSRRPTGLAK
ncbi:hypothetical protein ACQJBY_045302 [Aegilops geniculata]